MSRTDVNAVEMTGTARTNIQTFIRALNQLSPARPGAEVGAWLTTTDDRNAAVDFRVPHSDFKHPSSIEVNLDADRAEDVFSAGKYQAIRFETIGRRTHSDEELQRRYSNDSTEHTSLQQQHEAVIQERERAFSAAVQSVASNHSGIRVRVDTGDAAFSRGYHRPHVRFSKVNTDGATLGSFIQDCVAKVEEEVYSQYHIDTSRI